MSATFKDFEEATSKAHFRYTSAAVLSIVVSWFDLSNDPKLIAFAFDGVCEPLVEVGLLIIALYLGLNYTLRVFDERKILSEISEDMDRYKQRVDISWANVLDETERAQGVLREIEGMIPNIRKVAEIKKEFLEEANKLKRENATQPTDGGNYDFLEYKRDHIDALLSTIIVSIPGNYKLGEKLSEAIVQSEKTMKEGRQFQAVLTRQRVFVGVAKFRIWLTYYIVPFVLMVFMGVAIFYGESN